MTYLQASLLGFIQGLTEFLPVSSSGHLVLVQHLFGLQNADQLVAFDAALHMGTLLAVIFVFFTDLKQMVTDCYSCAVERSFNPTRFPGARLAMMIVVATIPAVLMGIFFKDFIEALFVSTRVAGYGLIFTGTVLWVTRYIRLQTPKEVSILSALLIGLAQSIAIIPGVSRSGSTITAGLFCKMDKNSAARFSFLMAVPAILGASVLQGLDILQMSMEVKETTFFLGPLLVGTSVSAITGFFAIKWLLSIVRKGQLHWFAPYCWGVGVLALVFL